MKGTIHPHAALSGKFLLGGSVPIYRFGFGAMRITGPGIWGDPKNPREAKAVLHKAIELGINFFDTADSYGPEVSEQLIADTLHPYPADLIIATKGGFTRQGPDRWIQLGRPEYLIQCVEMSLRRLKLDCIDLYQLHCIDPKVPLEESLGALKKMQQEGKIRHIGLSNVKVEEIERARKIVQVVSIQNHYNIIQRKSESVLHYCEQNGLAFIPWYPLASGELSRHKELGKIAEQKRATPAQIALAWLLKKSAVTVPIAGTSTAAHLEENIGAVALEFNEKEFNLLDTI